MTPRRPLILATVAFAAIAVSSPNAQELRALTSGSQRNASAVICGTQVLRPGALPPANSGPVVFLIAPCFEAQPGRPQPEPLAYLRDIHLRPSRPSQGEWVPYDAVAERQILDDFQRLRSNHALDSVSIEVRDYRFSNGVIGKLVTYHLKERN